MVGGGPSGATVSRELARRGIEVLVLEAARFPRFQIGESFLPRTRDLLAEIGLADEVAELPQTLKLGAEFVMGHGDDQPSEIRFADALGPSGDTAFNVARADFDRVLLAAARDAGVEVWEEARVRRILGLADDNVQLELADGRRVMARQLVDASGQAAVVGRHLGLRRVLPAHRKVAFFGHYEGVWRNPGDREGFITVVICDEGWFWVIPLDAERTSVGLVLDEAAFRQTGLGPRQVLAWAIERCPEMKRRCARATPLGPSRSMADFSYRCAPYAGPGFVLLGDAALFLDPVFSTGVCLGMVSATRLAPRLAEILAGRRDADATRRWYRGFVESSSAAFFKLVDHFYDPAFRDLFLEAHGPLGIHRAAVGVLAGSVFPLPWALRWRLWLLDLSVALQRRVAVVPRRRGFSLLGS